MGAGGPPGRFPVCHDRFTTCRGGPARPQVAGRKASPEIAYHRIRFSAHGAVDGELLCTQRGGGFPTDADTATVNDTLSLPPFTCHDYSFTLIAGKKGGGRHPTPLSFFPSHPSSRGARPRPSHRYSGSDKRRPTLPLPPRRFWGYPTQGEGGVADKKMITNIQLPLEPASDHFSSDISDMWFLIHCVCVLNRCGGTTWRAGLRTGKSVPPPRLPSNRPL